jgi:hypothetical protein
VLEADCNPRGDETITKASIRKPAICVVQSECTMRGVQGAVGGRFCCIRSVGNFMYMDQLVAQQGECCKISSAVDCYGTNAVGQSAPPAASAAGMQAMLRDAGNVYYVQVQDLVACYCMRLVRHFVFGYAVDKLLLG